MSDIGAKLEEDFIAKACVKCKETGMDNDGHNCMGCGWTRRQLYGLFAPIIQGLEAENISLRGCGNCGYYTVTYMRVECTLGSKERHCKENDLVHWKPKEKS